MKNKSEKYRIIFMLFLSIVVLLMAVDVRIEKSQLENSIIAVEEKLDNLCLSIDETRRADIARIESRLNQLEHKLEMQKMHSRINIQVDIKTEINMLKSQVVVLEESNGYPMLLERIDE